MESPQIFPGPLVHREPPDLLESLQNLDQRADPIIKKLEEEAGLIPAGSTSNPKGRGRREVPKNKLPVGIQESSRIDALELLSLYKSSKKLVAFDQNKDRLRDVLVKLKGKASTIRGLLGDKPSTEPKRDKRSSPDQTEGEGAAAPASLEPQQPPVVARQEEHAAAAAPSQQQEAQQQRDVVVPIPPSPQEGPASKRRRQIGEYIEEHKGIAAYAGAGATAIVRVGAPLLTNPVTLATGGIAYGAAGELARRTLRNWPKWNQRQRKWAKISGGTAAISTTVGGVALFGPAFLLFPIAPALIGSAGFGGALAAGSLTPPGQRADVEMGAPAAQPQVQPPPQPPAQNQAH
jgi:hypothetical protein